MAVANKPKIGLIGLLAVLAVCASSALAFVGDAEAHSWNCHRHSGNHCTDFSGANRWTYIFGALGASGGYHGPVHFCVGKKKNPNGGDDGRVRCEPGRAHGGFFGKGMRYAYTYFVHPNLGAAYLQGHAEL